MSDEARPRVALIRRTMKPVKFEHAVTERGIRLIDVAFVLPSFAGGGAQKVLLTLAARLDRSVYRPTLYVFDARGPWRTLVAPNLRLVITNKSRLREALFGVMRALRADRPDIVVSTMTYVNVGMLLIKPLLRGARIVLREANTSRRVADGVLANFFFKLSYRWLYRCADLVICPARYMADELAADHKIDASRIAVLPNPLDEEGLRVMAKSPRRRAGEGRCFVAVGRLTSQKGYERLLNDFAQLPHDSNLLIFGEGELRAKLERQIGVLGLGKCVVLAGFDPNPAPWIAGADALLLPSLWEGLPNVALEALACGTPVIATPEAGAIDEIAEGAPAGAVTIAASGRGFVDAMSAVKPNKNVDIRTSLLPDIYKLPRSLARFDELLRGLNGPSA